MPVVAVAAVVAVVALAMVVMGLVMAVAAVVGPSFPAKSLAIFISDLVGGGYLRQFYRTLGLPGRVTSVTARTTRYGKIFSSLKFKTRPDEPDF